MLQVIPGFYVARAALSTPRLSRFLCLPASASRCRSFPIYASFVRLIAEADLVGGENSRARLKLSSIFGLPVDPA